MDRDTLLMKLSEASFAAFDLQLFLNTHPHDRRALAEHRSLVNQANAARDEFEKAFGPLTAAATTDENFFNWIDSPWPWDAAGN